jgi:hypothetical protein
LNGYQKTIKLLFGNDKKVIWNAGRQRNITGIVPLGEVMDPKHRDVLKESTVYELQNLVQLHNGQLEE